MAINSGNVVDRVKLCWGHLRNWQRLKIVQESKKWLEKTNASFVPTTFIAYDKETPVGMIEFIPQKQMKKYRLCPCRASPEPKSIEDRYSLGKKLSTRSMVWVQLVEWRVESTRWPVSAEWSANSTVSASLSSPMNITLGACRNAFFSPSLKENVSAPTSRWVTKLFLCEIIHAPLGAWHPRMDENSVWC